MIRSAISARTGRTFAGAALLPIAILLGGFAAVMLWFGEIDFYHRHFFDTGVLVLADNIMRVWFCAILCWLIYAPGAGIVALLSRVQTAPQAFSPWPAERAMLGFGIGIGVWEVVLLILGEFNLYYRPVMIVLCAAVLVASARHFAAVAQGGWSALAFHARELRAGRMIPQTAAAVLVVAAGVCLLLVRGLYPGGGGDYYTHYFYYYQDVLKHHGLDPNDVWYHYWYSQGYGLFFLGMLLTDPLAPTLVTFCCVAFAALAMALLTARLAPGSWWPACVALIYLLFNLVNISYGGGGEFEKAHEQASALLVLAVWAVCMEGASRNWLFLLMAGAVGVAAAIITQSMGVLIGLFLGALMLPALLRGHWREACAFGLATFAVGGAVLAVLLLSYLATGLATDQSLDLMLRFADIGKLDRWGVLPQIVMVAWDRDGYEAVAPALDLPTKLGNFVRFEVLKTFFAATVLFALAAAAITLAVRMTKASWVRGSRQPDVFPFVRPAVIRLGGLLILLIVFSVAAGRVQYASYGRFSTFFVPLFLLEGMAVSGWALLAPFPQRIGWVLRYALPAVVLMATLASWQVSDELDDASRRWASRVSGILGHGLRFFVGKYSLAEAYSHQDIGLPFGGINPQALEAWRHAAPPAPIWATNVDSYCMVPGCTVESVQSFKLSPRLDEIVTGPPEVAKRLLQEAGMNYFLFLPDSVLLDILPFSEIFTPGKIGQYFGVKWTDGSAYLLTWIGPDTKPLDRDFYDFYRKKLAEPEHPWFQFSSLAGEIGADTTALRRKSWGTVPEFAWRQRAPQGTLDVVSASYGGNCRGHMAALLERLDGSYATALVEKECRGKKVCTFNVNADLLDDPNPACAKGFSVTYRCAPDEPPVTATIGADAAGSSISLGCNAGIQVLDADYGGNCRTFRPPLPSANSFAPDNATSAVAQKCDGKAHCFFRVDVAELGDPANGCSKDFSVRYVCRPEDEPLVKRIDAEAHGKAVELDCPNPSGASAVR